ncbi:MAG TPA: TatD family hydrolase [Kofleriaceae bacterium]|nr:TatD family hydrolase [Kofleriaceae bacterium]
MIDTHCHLDDPRFDPDREDVLARARAAGVRGILVPAVRPKTWDATLALARDRDGLRVAIALGVHPQCVPDLEENERSCFFGDAPRRLEAALAAHEGRFVAVGECGLDGATAEMDEQERIFRAHIRVARALGLPLVVHVFRAHDRAPAILRDEGAREVGGVLHSYSGGADLVPIYRDLGFAFSFAGPITYANARRPIEAARAVPGELLLAETDAPDQAPAPHRGGRSEPAFVASVIDGLARARGVTPDAIKSITTANAQRIFRAWSIP